jgi:hypothetical protein
MRINRIPQSLRTVNIEDLIDKYATNLDPPPAQALPPAYKPAFSRTNTANSKESVVMTSSPMRKGLKRDRFVIHLKISYGSNILASSDMMGQSDKENAGADLDLPKKRARTANNTLKPSGAAQTRPVSRKVDPSKVLSPKSHNSRTYPQSPVKPFSPAKSALARPVSPIKPGTVAAATASLASLVSNTSTKTGSIRGKLARANMAPPPVPAKRGRPASQSSQTSDSSAQTTIVKRPGVVRKAVSKATGMTAAATGRTKAVGRKEIPAPSATGTGGRTLRSRR